MVAKELERPPERHRLPVADEIPARSHGKQCSCKRGWAAQFRSAVLKMGAVQSSHLEAESFSRRGLRTFSSSSFSASTCLRRRSRRSCTVSDARAARESDKAGGPSPVGPSGRAFSRSSKLRRSTVRCRFAAGSSRLGAPRRTVGEGLAPTQTQRLAAIWIGQR
jgi:hypothetical protein